MPGWEEQENEWRYRLREPSLFDPDSFRTKTLKPPPKYVHAVMGRLNDPPEEGSAWKVQALRFQKKTEDHDGFTLAEAKAWFADHEDIKKAIADSSDELFALIDGSLLSFDSDQVSIFRVLSEASSCGTPSEKEYRLIASLPGVRELPPREEMFSWSFWACSSGANVDGMRFSEAAIKDMAARITGKRTGGIEQTPHPTIMFGHGSFVGVYGPGFGRVFDADAVTNRDGHEGQTWLRVKGFMLRDPANEFTIKNINAGIFVFWSIRFRAKKYREEITKDESKLTIYEPPIAVDEISTVFSPAVPYATTDGTRAAATKTKQEERMNYHSRVLNRDAETPADLVALCSELDVKLEDRAITERRIRAALGIDEQADVLRAVEAMRAETDAAKKQRDEYSQRWRSTKLMELQRALTIANVEVGKIKAAVDALAATPEDLAFERAFEKEMGDLDAARAAAIDPPAIDGAKVEYESTRALSYQV